ncbi:unnamed protein product [marine sediment metagenome]|uniref:D,D-heptose 1,7-bisphosphate phosphatase n=1 Tax=marine sediment metagenome TaxID=412755 RepID=X0X5X7_9ZZZZ
MKRAVFLDRDGTIIEEVGYLRRIEDIRLLPGAAEALRGLKQAGFLLLVVTNQSAVARGWLNEQALEAIQQEINRLLQGDGGTVDAFYYCPHLPGAKLKRYARTCTCRKPKPGLLQRAARDWSVSLQRSYMVGDSRRDVEAGRRAGCCTILIGGALSPPADMVAADLREAANLILRKEQTAAGGGERDAEG